MKTLNRLTTLAVAAIALAAAAGTLTAQQRGGSRGGSRGTARAQAPRASAPSRSYARQDVRAQRYAPARSDVRGNVVRNNVRVDSRYNTRANYANARTDFRGGADFRGRGPAVSNGRPLITRNYVAPRGYGSAYGGAYGRSSGVYGGARFGVGFNRWGGRMVLPVGWRDRVVFGGYFPPAYASYCEAVPVDYDYMLPPMEPSYDPCLFGDRVVVYDRFSRGIVFSAALPL